jgi:hypothetical protein
LDARLILAALAFSGAAHAFDHQPWNFLLKKHVVVVHEGRASQVRYEGMARDRAALKAYLDSLSRVGEAEFQGWPKAEQMAFLINAYNAFTVEKILTRYPDIRSIWDFGRFFGNPFKDDFFTLLGRKASLDGIEHGMLRKRYRELRVHFAVNCASIGCPMLREEAYAADRLERQLEEQAVRFLSDRSRNRFANGRLEVSMIFDWFKQDFEPRTQYFARYAAVLGFAGSVPPVELPLSFLDYDWSLNDFQSSSPR